jgi:hypothetical protein
MAGLLRKTQQLFAGSLVPADNLSIWGSLLAGNVQYSNDPAAIQSAAWLNGFNGALIGNKSPTFQDLNAALYEITYQLQYILARGISEYDAGTQYNQFDICRIGNVIYSSLVNNNVGNAPPSAQWTNFFASSSSPNLCLAWALFSGIGSAGPLTVFNGFNVSGVTKLATGSYQVAFANALPSLNYGFVGSCGVANGATADAGSNDVVIGAPNGATGVHNQTACNVYVREPTQSPGLEDNGYIFVQFFGS